MTLTLYQSVARITTVSSLMLACLLIAWIMPIATAHPPPPETGGMVFALSGDSGDQTLLREGQDAAAAGDRLVTSGGGVDLGEWISPELSAPLEITGTTAILNLYAMPVGIVLGVGMYIDVTVMIDGEEMTSGTSETIILNEPLMTNIPWTSEPFDIQGEVGQFLEVNVVAHIDGVGAAQMTWGEADAPAEFALMEWTLNHTAGSHVDDEGAAISVEFATPWNCTDIEDVSLQVHGPVADHDEEWPLVAEPGEITTVGSACSWHSEVGDFSGTMLYRWKVEMTDGEIFNLTGDLEMEAADAGAVSTPQVSLIGGLFGSTLVIVPLLAVAARRDYTNREWGERFSDAVEPESRPTSAIIVWLFIGIGSGLLAGPVIAALTVASLALLFWALDSPEEGAQVPAE
jgi:hypothetical protein